MGLALSLRETAGFIPNEVSLEYFASQKLHAFFKAPFEVNPGCVLSANTLVSM
jgi:hypothetical protein